MSARGALLEPWSEMLVRRRCILREGDRLASLDDKRDSVSASHTVTCSASVDLCFESVLSRPTSLWGSKVVTY